MTMAVGFIAGNYAFLASDKRTTQLNPDGSNGNFSDGACKIFPISERILVFCGGVIAATDPLKMGLIQQFGGKRRLNSVDLEKISHLCRREYKVFMSNVDDKLKNSPWLRDFVLSVIIADNAVKPRLIRFDIEDDFRPIIQTNQGALCVKSAVGPEELWPEIEKIVQRMQTAGNISPVKLIDAIFCRASEMDASISYKHDIFQVASPAVKKSLLFQKITGGTITATISIKGPLIYGGRFYGPDENNAYLKVGAGALSNLGDLSLYRGNGGDDYPAFQIYDNINSMALRTGVKMSGGVRSPMSFLTVHYDDLSDNIVKTRAYGEWDFTNGSIKANNFSGRFTTSSGYIDVVNGIVVGMG